MVAPSNFFVGVTAKSSVNFATIFQPAARFPRTSPTAKCLVPGLVFPVPPVLVAGLPSQFASIGTTVFPLTGLVGTAVSAKLNSFGTYNKPKSFEGGGGSIGSTIGSVIGGFTRVPFLNLIDPFDCPL